MFQRITDDLEALLDRLPPHIAQPIQRREDSSELLEVIMDLGRLPQARYPECEITLNGREITQDDIEYVVSRIGAFGGDNRAGIARTLHRISAIRNRSGNIVGITCRVGRAVYGTIKLIEDLIGSGKSILLMGGPGVGKTTMLREMARVLADDLKKRVVVVDTSNEIAGDGDIPHPAIGSARRMQVSTPKLQHAVMIEAVENHMPEVIVIDEIGTELEALAARTIAERGVQLVATAHGNTLDNLVMNPTLADLIGGIQSVTLGDEEAKRRGTQKSILERKAPPTFDIVVEIQDWHHVAVHADVANVIDSMLRGRPVPPELRWVDEHQEVRREQTVPATRQKAKKESPGSITRIYPFGINRARLEQTVNSMHLPAKMTNNLKEATLLMTSRSYYRKKAQPIRDAEAAGIPIYVLKNNGTSQMEQSLANIFDMEETEDQFSRAMREAEEAIAEVAEGVQDEMDLKPQNSYIRMLQHQLAERFSLKSQSTGREPHRRVRIYHG
ncbi:MAG: R3H domain-containing nucleic acid-binding protein [Chloroflexota bacterium]|nr:R3H domain-containing nucleic acid-binding protein [Chloroflexota bacterium]